MILVDIETGKELKGIIEKVNQTTLEELKNDKNFVFDWSTEIKKEVYQVRLKERRIILGLISLIDYPKEFRIHINLIESRKNQRGKKKKIGNISGCLIAYACREAFKKGYSGFVSLVPKTQLVSYYKRYGFIEIGTQMAIFDENSKSLISKYFADEEL